MPTIRLPFRCDPIPEEHRFGKLVRVTEDREHLDVARRQMDTIASMRLSQAWLYGEVKGRARPRIVTTDGRPFEGPKRPSRQPYVQFTIELVDGRTIAWFWDGAGDYDGWAVGNDDPKPAPAPAES